MRPRLCLLAVMVAFGLLAGCKQISKGPPAYPPDPLLLSKKPAEEPNRPAERTQLAAAEPAVLPFPVAEARQSGPRLAAQPAVRPRGPVPVLPAVRSRANHNDPTACFAHAADHSWLQGILDKHYEGHFYLRFDDPTAEQPWGGKVRLDDDPRLQRYRDGDRVRIEGNVLPELESTPPRWGNYPLYRIRSIRPIPNLS